MKVLSLLMLFAVISCQKKNVPQAAEQEGTQMTPMTYLALGDSYTIGESVSESDRWPVQLAARLNQEGLSFESPQIIARTGWTTDELREGISQSTLHPPYDLVSLLIGVNNQYRGRSVDNFIPQFEYLLEKAIEFAGNDTSRVFVVSIPDYGVTPFGKQGSPAKIGYEIDAYNAAQKTICEKAGILFYNITPISRKAADDPELVASDGLHPSGKMYREWVDLFLQDVIEQVKP